MTKKKTGHIPPPEDQAPIAIPKANDLISQDEVVDFITKRVGQPEDAFRDARRKVRGKVEYAIKTGRLEPTATRQLTFGDVVRWARQKKNWGEPLKGLPETAFVAPTHNVRAANAAEYAVTEKDSDTLLNEAYERINALEGRVSLLQAEVDELRPIAKRSAEIKEKHRESGRMGGRPRGGRK